MTDHISILKNYLKSLERKKLLADTLLYDKEQINKEIEAFKAAIKALEETEEGRWIIEREEETGKMRAFHCSKCYEETGHFVTIASNFCPECGAKMNFYPIEEWECIKDGDTE